MSMVGIGNRDRLPPSLLTLACRMPFGGMGEFHTGGYANYDFLCRTFVQRLIASAKRTAQAAMTLNTVMAISFPDIQTPLGVWLSGQSELCNQIRLWTR